MKCSNDTFIDVIVPVYNVETYLKKCIESLLNQSVNNYIITLVDDGSIDSSGYICDTYAKNYPEKIRVFHKKNGGLSDARNFGVEKSEADYIIFVDSDDYVNSEFIKNLQNGLDKNVEIVVSPICKEFLFDDEKRNIVYPKIQMKRQILTTEQALEYLCYEKEFGNYAVSKLFKRNILEKCPYPMGKYYEDSYTTYKQIYLAKKICFVPEIGYYYLQREGSIQRSAFDKKHFDLMLSVEEMMQFLEEKNMPDSVMQAAKYRVCRSSHITLRHATQEKEFAKIYTATKNIFGKYIKDVLKNKNVSYKNKGIFCLMNFNGGIYQKIFKYR